MVDLDDHQLKAFADIKEFAKLEPGAPGPKIYTLHGLAGTGKSTTLVTIARETGLPMCAPTGKAASVLRAKSGLFASTIHQQFFQLSGVGRKERRDPERYRTAPGGTRHSVFTQALNPEEDNPYFTPAVGAPKAVLCDETSMVGAKLANNMLATGVRIVAVGDPGQLPPVEDKPFFNRPDFILPKIHRQAMDNPIIRQAHRIRHGQPYEADGDRFQVLTRPTKAHALAADAIICWRNATKDQITDIVRDARGIRHLHPQAGEPIICLKNNYTHSVFNGQIGYLIEPFEPGDSIIHFSLDGVIKIIPQAEFRGMKYPGFDQPVISFDFGYALTAHKAQGSEWPSIIVIDEMPKNHQDRAAHLYTSVTRASERCIVVPR
jgi:exodeoxyribonuclease-5